MKRKNYGKRKKGTYNIDKEVARIESLFIELLRKMASTKHSTFL